VVSKASSVCEWRKPYIPGMENVVSQKGTGKKRAKKTPRGERAANALTRTGKAEKTQEPLLLKLLGGDVGRRRPERENQSRRSMPLFLADRGERGRWLAGGLTKNCTRKVSPARNDFGRKDATPRRGGWTTFLWTVVCSTPAGTTTNERMWSSGDRRQGIFQRRKLLRTERRKVGGSRGGGKSWYRKR